jgi:myo-inositol-1(or 4)-monophosphatase
VDPLEFLISVAREAGALLRARFDDPHDIVEKRPHDLVTEADRASEAAIVGAIGRSFPGASVLAEEGGIYGAPSRERFIVDPLDGTTNYAHRYPLFCVSIAYEVDGQLEAGVVEAPLLGLTFAARRGRGATLNGSPMTVSPVAALARALVSTGFSPVNYARNGPYFAAVSGHAQGVRRDGSAALDLALVAAGRYDAFWEWDLKPWDVAAGHILVAEAGGRISAIDGSEHRIDAGSTLASNSVLHPEMIACLSL